MKDKATSYVINLKCIVRLTGISLIKVDVRWTCDLSELPLVSQVEVFICIEFNYILNFVGPQIRGILTHFKESVRKGILDRGHQ